MPKRGYRSDSSESSASAADASVPAENIGGDGEGSERGGEGVTSFDGGGRNGETSDSRVGDGSGGEGGGTEGVHVVEEDRGVAEDAEGATQVVEDNAQSLYDELYQAFSVYGNEACREALEAANGVPVPFTISIHNFHSQFPRVMMLMCVRFLCVQGSWTTRGPSF